MGFGEHTEYDITINRGPATGIQFLRLWNHIQAVVHVSWVGIVTGVLNPKD